MQRSEHFLNLSLAGREMFRYLFGMCDDEGLIKANANSLRLNACRNVIVALDEVESQFDLMVEQRMILPYRFGIDDYVWVVNFRKHQQLDKPHPTILPRPPREKVEKVIAEVGPLNDRMQALISAWGIGGFSANNREQSRAIDVGIGKGIGKGSSNSVPNGTVSTNGVDERDPTPSKAPPLAIDAPPARGQQSDIERVFDTWVEATGKRRGATVLTKDRSDLIKRRLEQYPVGDLLAAVVGWRHDPHNRGENDRHRPYNDLKLILRDADHIERFRDLELTYRDGRIHELPRNAPRGALATQGHSDELRRRAAELRARQAQGGPA